MKTGVLPATAQGCLELRNQLYTEIKSVLDLARKETRELTGEEIQINEEKLKDMQELKNQHDKLVGQASNRERQNRLVHELSFFDENAPANSRITTPNNSGNPGGEHRISGFDEPGLQNGFRRFSWELENRRGYTNRVSNRALDIGGRRASDDYRCWARQQMVGNHRSILLPNGQPANTLTTIQTGVDERAGYFVLPEQMTGEILKTVDDDVWIQSMARVTYLRDARSVGIRRRTAKANAFNWGTELSDATDNMENQLAYGKRVLTPHWLTGSFRLSRELLAMADINIEAEIISELMIDLREFLEASYMTGTGVQRPLGLLTAHADGISTGRDLTYGTTATTFNFNSIINAKYKMKGRYKKNAVLMLHPDRISEIAQLREDSGAGAGTGQYLWVPSRVANEPDVVCGIPIKESYFMPSATGAGLYFGLLGDFSYYRIIIGLDLEMQMLKEMRARTNENEYLFRMKIDAAPVMEEAFYRLTYVG